MLKVFIAALKDCSGSENAETKKNNLLAQCFNGCCLTLTSGIYYNIIKTLTVDLLFDHNGHGVAEYQLNLPSAAKNCAQNGKMPATSKETSFAS